MVSENNTPNRLIHEKSPYLLQHAHNPVDWHPWGDEAFEESKRRDVPVFLSIGYSSCHWCHVMERECFEDAEVAARLNEGFVCVKVDREERPDVDHLYMEACVALTGSGGWPLTCFLDENRRPFFAGTYFPKNGRYGMPGLMELLDRLGRIWRTDRRKVLEAAEAITTHMNEQANPTKRAATADASDAAFRQLEKAFDAKNGGFGSAPKFPTAHNLLFLLRYGRMNPQSSALTMAARTLDAMAAGGIFDHIGGGFCRYSTDARWLVPHFEKMLYDNAMLAMACCEASAALGNAAHADTARRVLEYCTREMRGEDGGFFTAQDADSEGVEGKAYLWTPAQVAQVLGAEEGGRFCRLMDVTEQGNFEGSSIPNRISRDKAEDERTFLEGCFPRLLEARQHRPQPFKDDKVLASSNGLMVAALAIAGRLLDCLEYRSQAERTAQFLLDSLVKDGRLLSSWRGGVAVHRATSDDYAYLLWGLVELYQSTHKPHWLRLAIAWADNLLSLFWDDQQGGLFLAGADVRDLLVRQKNFHDGALPCGNSVAALNLLRLGRITGREEYEEKAAAILDAMAGTIAAYPSGCAGALMTQLYQKNLGTEIVIANGNGLGAMLNAAEGYLPFTTVAVRGAGYEEMDDLAPAFVPMEAKFDAATAYLCSRGACQQPVTDAAALAEKLKKVF